MTIQKVKKRRDFVAAWKMLSSRNSVFIAFIICISLFPLVFSKSGVNCPTGCGDYGNCLESTETGNCTECVCPNGYLGDCCEDPPTDGCASNPCGSEGHWNCTSYPNGVYECKCEPGYTGDKCDALITACDDDGPCYNYDQCTVNGTDYECDCKDKFIGDQCERYSNCNYWARCMCNDPKKNPCKNGGTCIEKTGGKYQCLCPEGYAGDDCDDEPCEKNECKNGGACVVDEDGDATCVCLDIWEGDKCDQFNVCAYKQCQNGGTCTRKSDTEINCQCPCGFTGTQCETPLDFCASKPCKWEAPCTSLNETCDYSCDCPDGTSGKSCENKPDNCRVNGWQTVCKSMDLNAICTDLIGGYNCTCSDDYTGKNCETSIIVWKVIQELGGGEEDIIDLLEEVVQSPGLIKDIMPFILGQQSVENQSAMSWDYEDLFVWAAYENTELDIKKDIYKWYDITLGNCFTFNHQNASKHYSLRYSGETGGFKTLMRVQQQEYVGWINTAALLVFVHPMDENIFQESVRYQVANGTSATVITNKISYQRLGGKYGTCAKDPSEVESYYYSGSYSSSGCLRGCYQDAVEEMCGCMDPRYAKSPEATNCALNKWDCVNNVTEIKGDASNWESCVCPVPCEESQYESRYGLSPFVKAPYECMDMNEPQKSACLEGYQDMALISVYVPTLTHKVFAETPKMSFNQFFSNVGGLAGVFIGFSIVTIVDFVFLFVLVGRVAFGCDQENKKK